MVMHFNTTCLWSLFLSCSQPIDFLEDPTSRTFTPWWVKVELVACQMFHCPYASAPCWIMWTKHILVFCYFLKKFTQFLYCAYVVGLLIFFTLQFLMIGIFFLAFHLICIFSFFLFIWWVQSHQHAPQQV